MYHVFNFAPICGLFFTLFVLFLARRDFVLSLLYFICADADPASK